MDTKIRSHIEDQQYLTSNIRTLRSNTETRITPFGHKNSCTYEHQQYLMCYLKISKNLILKKSLFLQLNSISSIKLMLMRYKLLINLAFIFSLLLLSLSELNRQIVYINFVWVSYFCFRIITCDLSTCDLWQQRFLFSCFLFYALLYICFNLIYL